MAKKPTKPRVRKSAASSDPDREPFPVHLAKAYTAIIAALDLFRVSSPLAGAALNLDLLDKGRADVVMATFENLLDWVTDPDYASLVPHVQLVELWARRLYYVNTIPIPVSVTSAAEAASRPTPDETTIAAAGAFGRAMYCVHSSHENIKEALEAGNSIPEPMDFDVEAKTPDGRVVEINLPAVMPCHKKRMYVIDAPKYFYDMALLINEDLAVSCAPYVMHFVILMFQCITCIAGKKAAPHSRLTWDLSTSVYNCVWSNPAKSCTPCAQHRGGCRLYASLADYCDDKSTVMKTYKPDTQINDRKFIKPRAPKAGDKAKKGPSKAKSAAVVGESNEDTEEEADKAAPAKTINLAPEPLISAVQVTETLSETLSRVLHAQERIQHSVSETSDVVTLIQGEVDHLARLVSLQAVSNYLPYEPSAVSHMDELLQELEKQGVQIQRDPAL